MFSPSEFVKLIMNAVSHLVKESLPNYLHNLPIPDSFFGWFSLGITDWAKLVPFGVAVGGLSYLSLQVSRALSLSEKYFHFSTGRVSPTPLLLDL